MSGGRALRAPHWPDRSAHRRRRSARRMFWVVAVLVVVVPWAGYRQVREWIGPRMDQPSPGAPATQVPTGPGGRTAAATPAPSLVAATPVDIAASAVAEAAAADEVDAIGREARVGDGEAAIARLEGLGAQIHRDALLADRGSAVRREAARRDVAAIGGVRAAGWIDRMTMLLLVSGRGQAHSTIAEACRRLVTHGDVAGLAVRVQEVGGGSGDALLGECRRGQGMVPGPQHTVPGVPLPRTADGSMGALETPEDPAVAAERRRREEESLRILSESTPELPSVPQARADP